MSFYVGVDYIRIQYEQKNNVLAEKQMYCHTICAIHKENMEKVFADIQQIAFNTSAAHGELF